jgi:hypothetical protein
MVHTFAGDFFCERIEDLVVKFSDWQGRPYPKAGTHETKNRERKKTAMKAG